MPSITVKNIPDPIYSRLKHQAEVQHRSMNSEIIACLEKMVGPSRVSSDEILLQARQMRSKVKGSMPIEEFYNAMKSSRA